MRCIWPAITALASAAFLAARKQCRNARKQRLEIARIHKQLLFGFPVAGLLVGWQGRRGAHLLFVEFFCVVVFIESVRNTLPLTSRKRSVARHTHKPKSADSDDLP